MPPTPITILARKITESVAFKARFADIQISASKRRLSFEQEEIDDEKIGKLLLQGSALALSNEIAHRGVSQKINALLHEIMPEEELVNYAIQILSSRLGNYPVISSRSEVFGGNNIVRKLEQNADSVSTLDPEVVGSLYDEEENSRLQIKEKTYHFNWYQKEILEALSSKPLVSFSAPTSFGKSFIVRHHIARQFANNALSRALIIVPTKSLIDDFYEGVLALKKDLGLDFTIYTHARSIQNVPDKTIFILTQERLTFLIDNNPEFVRSFQIIYCDEAHYISRGYRGFVLRSVLRKVVNLCGIRGVNGDAQYIFSSPLIKNPQYYQEKFFPELATDQSFHKEVLYSPVEKNVHFVNKGDSGFSFMLFRDPLGEETFAERLKELGTREFPLHLRGQKRDNSAEKEITRDVHIVLNSGLDARTILYTTSPMKAHKYANELGDRLPEKGNIAEQELVDLKRYIRDHYDECFGLIELIKKGIGLHYGSMPIGLRRTIVDLFEKGHIDYIVCTSTLLEGVNLPAKNIFLFSNIHNRTQKHSPLSFWNLIGRAGRITYGLSGNIFCIADSPEKYEELFNNKETEIKDPENDVSENDTKRSHVVSSFLEQENEFTYLKSPYRNDIEYLIYELLTTDNVGNIVDRFGLTVQERINLLDAIERSRDSLLIPLELLQKNPGIDPRLQYNLLVFLGTLTLDELRVLFEIASSPLAVNKLSLNQILEKTAETLRWPLKNAKYDVVDSTSGKITQWLHEASISQFIQQALRYHQEKSNLEKVEIALGVVGVLDTDLSYSAPKYIKCFFDISLYNASARGMRDTDIYHEKVESFLFAIESGVSSFIGRFLFEKGVARPLAIQVSHLVGEMAGGPIGREFFDRPEVIERLRGGLSAIAFNELADHIES